MRRLCGCGQKMDLGFRLVIFENKFQIDRVPILECEECEYYEVLPAIKCDLTNLLAQLKEEGEGGRVLFTEVNEFADVLYSSYLTWKRTGDYQSFEELLEQGCEERINMLLDLYSCAKKASDSKWMNEITSRLAPLSKFTKERQCLETK
ncbi:hypothetical protein D3C81_1147910 [compost metagenome]